MPLDQVPARARHGVELVVHGAPAWVDRAPLSLAARAGATVLVVGAAREGATQVVEVLDVLRPEESGGVRGATARGVARLEAFAVRHPASYLWLHRRWRAPAAGR